MYGTKDRPISTGIHIVGTKKIHNRICFINFGCIPLARNYTVSLCALLKQNNRYAVCSVCTEVLNTSRRRIVLQALNFFYQTQHFLFHQAKLEVVLDGAFVDL